MKASLRSSIYIYALISKSEILVSRCGLFSVLALKFGLYSFISSFIGG